jgi:hypothetical protein
MNSSEHVYEVRVRKDQRGVDLISDALPDGRLWYGEPDAISNAIGYAKFRSRSNAGANCRLLPSGQFDCDRSSAYADVSFVNSAVIFARDCSLAAGNGYRSIHRC